MKSTLRRRKLIARNTPAPVVLEGELRIPPITSFEECRDWARSEGFPEQGRIDYTDRLFRLDRHRDTLGLWEYELLEADEQGR